jgi:hypothetical protein
MIEIGRDAHYVEHWAREGDHGACGALRLTNAAQINAYLVWAAPWFAFARAHASDFLAGPDPSAEI